jgi:hypothetical protein
MLCRWSGALALFPLCALVAGHGAPACAQSLVSSQLQIDTGIGHEAQSAPVFQLTPESTIVYPDDLKHLLAPPEALMDRLPRQVAATRPVS